MFQTVAPVVPPSSTIVSTNVDKHRQQQQQGEEDHHHHHHHTWEQYKENTAPLQRGRNIHTIVMSNQQQQQQQQQQTENVHKDMNKSSSSTNMYGVTKNHDSITIHHNTMIQQFEDRIKRVVSMQQQQQQQQQTLDDTSVMYIRDQEDPLHIWVAYIKFLQDHVYISYTNQYRPIYTVLERCVHSFCRSPTSASDIPNAAGVAATITTAYNDTINRNKAIATQDTNQQLQHYYDYRNDIRYIKICCLYADQTVDPLYTFHLLYHQYQIGTYSAMYYNAWAFIAEKSYYYTTADTIFQHALSMLSSSSMSTTTKEQYDYILLRYQRFIKRMKRYYTNYMIEKQEQELDHEHSFTTTSSINRLVDIEEQIRILTNHHHATINSQHRGILNPISFSAASAGGGTRISSSTNTNSNNTRRQQPFPQMNHQYSTFIDTSSSQSNRVMHQQLPPPQQQSLSSSSFAIFSDDQDRKSHQVQTELLPETEHIFKKQQQHISKSNGSSVMPPLFQQQSIPIIIKDEERHKENRDHIPVEKWNESGGLKSSTILPTTATMLPTSERPSMFQSSTVVGFSIHIDDECIQQQKIQEEIKEQQLQQQLQQHRSVIVGQQQQRYDDQRINLMKHHQHQQRKGIQPTIKSKLLVTPSSTTTMTTITVTAKIKQKQSTKSKWNKELLLKRVKNNNIEYDEEQCFEEARYVHQQYTVLQDTDNFNHLMKDNNCVEMIDDDDENEMSMSMEELLSSFQEDTNSGTDAPDDVESKAFVEDHSHWQQPQQDASTASSTFNDKFSLNISNHSQQQYPSSEAKVPVIVSEPTINTQFAMRELSFMFMSSNSPIHQYPIPSQNEQQQEDIPIYSSKTITATDAVPVSTNTGFSIFHDDETESNNNQCNTKLDTKNEYSSNNDENVQHNEQEHEQLFTIFHDDDFDKGSLKQQQQNFTIFSDDDCDNDLDPTNEKGNFRNTDKTKQKTMGQKQQQQHFTIFSDDDCDNDLDPKNEKDRNADKAKQKTMGDDDTVEAVDVFSVGDTVEFTLSVLNVGIGNSVADKSDAKSKTK